MNSPILRPSRIRRNQRIACYLILERTLIGILGIATKYIVQILAPASVVVKSIGILEHVESFCF